MDIDEIKTKLTQARATTNAASRKVAAAQLSYDKARRVEDRLRVALKKAEISSDAGTEQRDAAGADLRERLAARADKYAFTFPVNDRWYHDARRKGGWSTSVMVRHNLVQVPPDGQPLQGVLDEYNEGCDCYEQYAYDASDLPEYMTRDWPWQARNSARNGETPQASIVASIHYQPTGMTDTSQVAAQVMHEVAIDPDGPAPTADELMRVWDEAWAKMRTTELTPCNPQLLA